MLPSSRSQAQLIRFRPEFGVAGAFTGAAFVITAHAVWLLHDVTLATKLAFTVLWCCSAYNAMLARSAQRFTPLKTDQTGPGEVCQRCSRVRAGRSGHCFACNGCVPRRDHHCAFLGVCLGEANFVPYFRFLIFSTATAALAATELWSFLGRQPLPNDGLAWDLVAWLAPLLAWALGHSALSLYSVYLSTAVRLAVTAFLGVGGLACFQLFLLLRGQTWGEFQRGSRPFDRGAGANAQVMLGKFGAQLFWFQKKN